jgi:thiamine pyrophosphokinase
VHLLIMQRRIPERVADFDSVRDKVYSEYKDSERRRAAEENLAILRREAHIVLAPGAGE